MSATILSSSPLAPATTHPTSAQRFVVGQDPQGRWVAAEIHGLAGGLFRTQQDAMHYAIEATDRRPDAVTVTPNRVELRI
ncbi:hypothetical protein PMNALOAF_3956 [Methylobacterium adhaesivum]|uniref:DUF2188 domain-containing protein n=1 Tax=Methylobacterium adhaesivum TaxID=333297 RepID=A0ABT8BGY6_9HYPH|nr:hypothetical protein [Methylobacterium adhaesivum]MDN3591407.1 hypothetical protein [Methylobacterium adhaesivum]GJD32679.1 hypothetical protein PMNALOAF_3956 [Methylobacterium adhaesivum]